MIWNWMMQKQNKQKSIFTHLVMTGNCYALDTFFLFFFLKQYVCMCAPTCMHAHDLCTHVHRYMCMCGKSCDCSVIGVIVCVCVCVCVCVSLSIYHSMFVYKYCFMFTSFFFFLFFPCHYCTSGHDLHSDYSVTMLWSGTTATQVLWNLWDVWHYSMSHVIATELNLFYHQQWLCFGAPTTVFL